MRDLGKLMGDEDHGVAFGDKGSNDREKAVDLLRGEHRGGLVEDEQARAAIERLENLDPLLHAY